MTNHSQAQSSLPSTANLPTVPQIAAASWFEYPVKAHPHHTDYAGVVWHGTYITWMEETRIEYLRSHGVDYTELVALGYEMPVVELSIRYHQPMLMGMTALVKVRMHSLKGVRINWDYQIQAATPPTTQPDLLVTAKVVLVVVERSKGKILRQLPPVVKNALAPLSPLHSR